MNLTDKFQGDALPFEGDQNLAWSSLPVGAKITNATITLKSVPPPSGTLFNEVIKLNGAHIDWGTTVITGTLQDAGVTKGYAEIDFHHRRTLVSIASTGFSKASLQIDVGGMYVKINSSGAISSPGDLPFELPADGALPSLTVSKFRLISQVASVPTVSQITVRSTPSNLAVKLGKTVPVWNRLGDLTDQDTSPDFAPLLQKFLATAASAGGFYDLPVSLHSDTIARLEATLNVDYLQQTSILPDGVKEVVLPFDFGSTPKADPAVLTAKLPPNARVATQATSAKVLGSFAETRVLYGPTGNVTPAASVNIVPNDSQAQLFSLNSSDSAGSLDLFIAPQSPGGTISIDLRADLDGKPDSTSLLGTPVQASLLSQANNQPTWLNVPFAQPFQFQKDKKYWLIFQSLQGSFVWSVVAGISGTPVMQHTQDGGLSWRETPAPGAATPPSGLFRLRQQPATFKVPIDLQVGSGAQAQRISLSRFQPLGRVDFDLGIPEVAQGFNNYLTKSAQTGCVEAEHLANGNFEQWTVVGNNPTSFSKIPVVPPDAVVRAIAMAPDGRNAYVVVDGDSSTGFEILAAVAVPSPFTLLTIDVACHKVSPARISWRSFDTPAKLVLHPDGNQILILGKNSTVFLADLEQGVATQVSAGRVLTKDFCFSPDGLNLHVLISSADRKSGTVSTIGVDAFTQAFGGTTLATPQRGPTPLSGNVACMTADSQFVYVAGNDGNKGTVTFLDAKTLDTNGAPVDVGNTGNSPTAIVVAADGSNVLTTNEAESSVALIKIDNRAVTPVIFTSSIVATGKLTPKAIAISSDNARAYVALQDPITGAAPGSVGIIDLKKRTALQTVNVQSALSSIAITPQGDELFVGAGAPPTLGAFTLGFRTPADWFVTSGQIEVLCSRGLSSAHVVAIFGELNSQGSGSIIPASAFSQVAPITGGCTYLFSFEGLATQPGAVAEILWRGADCGSQKTDSLPIPQADNPNVGFTTAAGGGGRTLALSRTTRLIKTSGRFKAPDNATAAEVRFVAPNGVAVVAAVSLMGSGEALQNGSLQSLQQGVPDQWQRSTSTALGFVVSPAGSETILRNNGANTTSLTQQSAVTSGKGFTLQFEGRRLSGGSDDPTVELHWLKDDGTEVGTAIVEKLSTASFEKHPMAGTVPDGATKVEVRLTLPTKTAIAVSDVSLHFPQLQAVPISFIAQSPGELRISSAQVGFDTVPPSPPPVPPAGLCPPTLPGQQPGQQASDSCHCSCCGDETKMTGTTPAMTPAGRPMMLSACANCGTQVVRGGGPLVAGSPTIPFRVVERDLESILARSSTNAPPARPPVLTDIIGIGKARAEKLQEAGINTVEDLAAANPESVAHALRGVSLENAAVLIEHAKRNLVSHN
jgi:DNA-binding beta-propeller fold protein YncE